MRHLKFRPLPAWLWLLSLVVVALAIRTWNPVWFSLSVDEAYSVSLARLPLSDIIRLIALDNHPPLYFLMLHAWISWFGHSEIAVRSLSWLFGTAAVAMVYLFAKEMFGKRPAVLAALLTAVGPIHVVQSQTARMYTLLELLGLLSLYGIVRIVRSPRPPIGLVLFTIVANISLVYTHVFGLYIVATLALCLATAWVWYRRQRPKPVHARQIWSAVFVIVVPILTFLPWLAIVVQQLNARQRTWLVPPTFIEFSHDLFGDWTVGLAALAIISLPLVNRALRTTNHIWIRIMTIIPILLSYAVSLTVFPSTSTRHLIVQAALWNIIIAASILIIKPIKLQACLVVWILIMNGLGTWHQLHTRLAVDWQQVTTEINARSDARDIIIFHQGYNGQFIYPYYTHDQIRTILPFPQASVLHDRSITATNLAELDAPLAGNPPQIILVTNNPAHDNLLRQYLTSHQYQSQQRTNYGYKTSIEIFCQTDKHVER